VIAGAARFPYPRFVAWDAPSAAAWSAAVASVGYVYGDDIAKRVDAFGTGLSLVAVAVLVGWLLVRRARRHQPAREPSR
jgi:membrane protein DedA with SNARE-associated domain